MSPQPSHYAQRLRAEQQAKGGGNERLSEYFNPEKHDQIVRRGELQAILDRLMYGLAHDQWYHRAWRGVQRYFAQSARAPLREEKKGETP